MAAWGLYELFCGGEGAVVCVVAVDERQAGIIFGIARRMVELDGELTSRCQIFKERLVIPARDAQFHCLPAEPKRLEGLDYTLAILDEAGVANRDSYEVLTLAQGKRERSTLVAIGTPGPDPNNQVLADLCGTMPPSTPTTSRWCGASFRPPASRTTRLTARTAGSWPTPPLMTSYTATPCTPCCHRRPARRRSGEQGCASSPPILTARSSPLVCGMACRPTSRSRTAPRWLWPSMVRTPTTPPRCCWALCRPNRTSMC